MADPVDLADIEIEAANRANLARRKPEGPKPVGSCLFCHCALRHGMRWCDSGCKEDWEKEQEALRRNGG